jgi:hypothetical protein
MGIPSNADLACLQRLRNALAEQEPKKEGSHRVPKDPHPLKQPQILIFHTIFNHFQQFQRQNGSEFGAQLIRWVPG